MTYHPMDTDPEYETTEGRIKQFGDRARDGARKLSDDARETARTAREGAREAVHYGQHQIAAAQSEFERGVQRNPGLAVLGALGAGIVLGMALRGRR
ncbi:hypothetical protein [Tropicibacter alexandrii]|uniref:hypothetical protein n=1 Tax=Tropicibacter alexandrii TaxID=2267683 RepID=UPI000EF43CBC|nr:hypothetical protein [Tropicibacter alexandrii]